MAKPPESKARRLLFRDLDSNIFMGTASDRYAGWIGQIYSVGQYEKGITRRSHKVGDKTFTEGTLPVESVTEYFEHFSLLEIDYTFYRLILGRLKTVTGSYEAEILRDNLKKGGELCPKKRCWKGKRLKFFRWV